MPFFAREELRGTVSRPVPTLLRGNPCGEQDLDLALALRQDDPQLWGEAAGRQPASVSGFVLRCSSLIAPA